MGFAGPFSVREELFNPDGAIEMPGTYKAFDDQKYCRWYVGGVPATSFLTLPLDPR